MGYCAPVTGRSWSALAGGMLGFLFVFGQWSSGCKTRGNATDPPQSEQRESEAAPDSARHPIQEPGSEENGDPQEEGTKVEANACPQGSTIWPGKLDACRWVVDGCCFSSAKRACRSKCQSGSGCEVVEATPATVRCVSR